MRLYFLIVFVSLFLDLHGQVSGVVLDDHKHPLVGASVVLYPDMMQTTTDVDGEFLFKHDLSGRYELVVSYIGYVSVTVVINSGAQNTKNLKIILEDDSELLETVVVSEEHAKQEATLHAEHLHEDFFKKNLEGNFAQTIEKLPGLSAINVGVGIAKPVIRGLSSNRIIVNHQGIKQEGQQWGSDHGLEIDQFDVERVEIIKGPGSLQYGSDGLGGVINILPDIILPKDSYQGSVIGVYKSNNDHWGGSAKLGFNVADWFLTARYSRQDFADYQVPAELFTYNGFDLSILNNRLKNTAGNEENISISTGVKRKWGITRFLYSHYSLDAGLFSGAVGVPRSYALTHDGNYRDIDVPQQKVDHYRLSLNQTIFFGDDHIAIDIGYQSNRRQEFSEPEFHSIPLSQLEDQNDKLALEFLLQTYSVAAHYEHLFGEEWKSIFGLNTQWQDNKRGGFEFLLPDFNTYRGGVYTIVEKNINDKWILNGGLRFDLGHNESSYYRQYVWDSNENIVDSLVSPSTDDLFFNWSASLGSSLTLMEDRWILKANFGKSFRVPYPAETVSNGIHHGTFRHEMGTPDLTSEHGYQLDLGVDYTKGDFSGNLSLYFNYFNDYIYLGPTFPARFSNLPEAGQIYQYRQDDAIYTGFEFEWDWDMSSILELHQAIDFVQSYNPETSLALPFTPQPSVRTDFTISPFENSWIKDTYVEMSHEYHFAAEGTLRVDRSEQSTPAYQLFGVGIGANLLLNDQKVKMKCQVQNLFNTTYLSHLSRYRVINIPEQGRNFVFTLQVPFGGEY